MSAEGLFDFVLLSKYEICSVLWGGLKLEGSNFVSLWSRRRSFLEIEGQYHFRPSPWHLLNLRWHRGCLTNCLSPQSLKHLCQLRAFLDFVFIFYFDFIPLTRFAKNTFDLQLCASILGALCTSMLVPWFASIFAPLYIAGVSIKFEVFRKKVPSYRYQGKGLTWYCPSISRKSHRQGHKNTNLNPY